MKASVAFSTPSGVPIRARIMPSDHSRSWARSSGFTPRASPIMIIGSRAAISGFAIRLIMARVRKILHMAQITPPRIEGRVRVRDGRKLGFAEFGPADGRPILWLHGTPGARRQIPEEARLAAEEVGVRFVG